MNFQIKVLNLNSTCDKVGVSFLVGCSILPECNKIKVLIKDDDHCERQFRAISLLHPKGPMTRERNTKN